MTSLLWILAGLVAYLVFVIVLGKYLRYQRRRQVR